MFIPFGTATASSFIIVRVFNCDDIPFAACDGVVTETMIDSLGDAVDRLAYNQKRQFVYELCPKHVRAGQQHGSFPLTDVIIALTVFVATERGVQSVFDAFS